MENRFNIYELRKSVGESYERLGLVLEDKKNNKFYLYNKLKDFTPYINLKSGEIDYREDFLYCTPAVLKVENFVENKNRGVNPSFIADVEIFNKIQIKDAKLIRYYSNRSFECIVNTILNNK